VIARCAAPRVADPGVAAHAARRHVLDEFQVVAGQPAGLSRHDQLRDPQMGVRVADQPPGVFVRLLLRVDQLEIEVFGI